MTIAVFLTALIGSMAIGVPIAFALLLTGIALMWYMGLFDTQIIAQNMVLGADSFQLLAIPFFLLAGELMNAGGLSKRIINFALAWVGHLHGGIGYVAIFAALIMASLSGSAAADSAALAAILIPMMREAGYNMPRSAGLISAGGIIAPVIPPSIAFIVFGVAANLSITKLFMAGIVPGVLMGVSLVVAWAIVSRRTTSMTVLPKQNMQVRMKSLLDGFFALVMPIAVLGGIRFGIVTPTEAGVLAAVYAFVIGTFVYRELKPRHMYAVLLTAAKTTAMVMFLIAAAVVSAWLITQANIPSEILKVLAPFTEHPTLLLLVILVLVLVVGTALDFTPTVLILTPVLMPVIKQVGIDPIYFGVLFIMANAIGLLTPPVGVVLNVVSGVGKVSMTSVIKGVTPFLVAQTLVIVLLILFPQLVLVPLEWLSSRR
ncbi:TRAP transporter large permease [Deinococcus peraridilitoris]|uniref:TRAP transporter, DctM subunit n=1 Tax=Deinococcus peraridilitoris (strain DSM 19664 / LMG 22246 / CIP 109416 / KR-200) TaxID=937777 RepID=L0A6G6_DEIPD|nr:TRAP transporter large permease subunit [Deinococcus peraridilitoris]AFZ69478.1 TRAP transporter, DctM subunit [Deinococcus peraridilitoris DSM 19664]